jgi:hypothetical protein
MDGAAGAPRQIDEPALPRRQEFFGKKERAVACYSRLTFVFGWLSLCIASPVYSAAEPVTNMELHNFIGHTISFANGTRISLLPGGKYAVHRNEQDELYAKYSIVAGNILEVAFDYYKDRYIFYKEGGNFYVVDKRGRRQNITSIESIDVQTTGGLGGQPQASGSENRSGIPLSKEELEKLLRGHTVRFKNGDRMSLAANGEYVFSRAGRADVRATYVIPAGNILVINSSDVPFDRYLYYRERGSYYAIDRSGRRLDIEAIDSNDQSPRLSTSR